MSSSAEGIGRVGVIGCGLMGSGIAALCAVAGREVAVAVPSEARCGVAEDRIARALETGVRKGTFDADRAEAARSRIRLAPGLDHLRASDLVIESIPELEGEKVRVLAALKDVLAGRDAIVATNTSSIPVARMAGAAGLPGRLLGVHFFSPVVQNPLVELIPPEGTDDAVVHRTAEFLTAALDKKVVRAPDRPGFLVNSLLIPYLLDAMRAVQGGLATPEAVDRAMELGCGHPVGPLRLSDMIGLDTLANVSASLAAESDDPRFATPEILMELLALGRTGKKGGAGFYDYRA